MEILAVSLIVIVFVGIFLSHFVVHRKWIKLPVMPDYVATNPACKTDRGLRCSQCSSSSIRNWGANDSRRTFACNHCGTKLYRSV